MIKVEMNYIKIYLLLDNLFKYKFEIGFKSKII